jgi:hypothetical protein
MRMPLSSSPEVVGRNQVHLALQCGVRLVSSFQRFFVLLHLNEHIPKDPEAVLLIHT